MPYQYIFRIFNFNVISIYVYSVFTLFEWMAKCIDITSSYTRYYIWHMAQNICLPLPKTVCRYQYTTASIYIYGYSVKPSALCPWRVVFVNMWHIEMNSICIIDDIFNSKTTESIK